MAKSTEVAKKKPGRPATGNDPLISARVPPATIAAIEAWAGKNGATRSEAIRRLIELGLTVKAKPKQSSAAGADRAKELAANAIDKMIDQSAPPEERAQRRRRLAKGPPEFREDRVDLPDAKK